MCHCCGETIDHFLLQCGKAYWLWSFVLRTFWDFVGSLTFDDKFSIYLVELVREAFISPLEFSSVVFDVVYLEETQSADV